MEIIQYSHYRKFPSQPRYVLTYDVPLFSLRFIAVLVNYEQSESMHDVWCLLCIFPRLFLLGRSRRCWRYHSRQAH
ncbi:hypothetical protein HMPREF1613_00536 [Escherichia coli 908616]|nr:hypothetical protein HMPREF1613_00536 [Escherichia coli 908616]